MSKLILSSESLNGILDGKRASRDDLLQAYAESLDDPRDLLGLAQTLREKNKGRTITFSKKAFFNAINMCRDVCSYCTYRAEPGDAKASMMSVSRVRELLQMAKRYRCVEALFVTGERPEERYPQVRSWLLREGFSGTAEYLAHCSQLALDEGLFPHTNAGNLHADELRLLKGTNVSLGLMLESSSARLAERGMPHHQAPSKVPAARLEVLENAGRLRIPMTTGILVGIGETSEEMIDSILAMRSLHERYGHIQEIILQNFQPEPGTAMGRRPGAQAAYFTRAVALARVAMPDMNIQVPPNLSPDSYQDFLLAGINDWGGISPITPDFVNPEFPWPQLARVDGLSRAAGFELKCRFPVYPEFAQMVPQDLRKRMLPMQDDCGLVREDYWR